MAMSSLTGTEVWWDFVSLLSLFIDMRNCAQQRVSQRAQAKQKRQRRDGRHEGRRTFTIVAAGPVRQAA
jgi:hypothetical protein